MPATLKKFRFSPAVTPLALLVICLISYVPFTHRLGFYWDDWPSMWFLHFLGVSSFMDSFSIDRPLLAGVFMLTTSFLGEAPLNWQIFSVITRWLASLALWWTVYGLWPGKPAQAAWIAILFAVYPGFSQQAIAVTYSNAMVIFSLFLFSLGAMVWAIRERSWFWPLMIASWVSAAFSLFTTEYFFGLEFFRPLPLWMLLQERKHGAGEKPVDDPQRQGKGIGRSMDRQVLVQAGRYWLPYLVILVAFLLWRFTFHESPRGQVVLFDQLRQQPLTYPFILLYTIVQDIIKSSLLAWGLAFNIRPIADFDTALIIAYAATALGVAALAFFFTTRVGIAPADPVASSKGNPAWAWQGMAVGFFALLVSGMPFWFTDLHLELFFPWDRFTMPMMAGACIFLVSLVTWASRERWPGMLALALLAGMAGGMQFQNRLFYRQDWVTQKSFFWELTWRAPGIQPGTLLMISELPFRYYSDNSLSAPLNWIYAPEQRSARLPYMLLDIESRLGKTLPGFEPGTAIRMDYRAAYFDGNTDQAIVMFYDPPRCLKILDPQRDRNLPYKPLYIPQALALSKPELIITDTTPGAAPPSEIFGPEPRYWCYYFEKAELARQVGDWAEVARLGDEGLPLKKKFTKETATELLTFIEGYARVGRWERALELSDIFDNATDKARATLCEAWRQISLDTPNDPAQQTAVQRSRQRYQCKFP